MTSKTQVIADTPAIPFPSVIPSMSDKVANSANIAAIDSCAEAGRFPYIIAWGKFLGFTPTSVCDQLAQAKADNAPFDAIQKIDGRWLIFGSIQNETNRRRVEELAMDSH